MNSLLHSPAWWRRLLRLGRCQLAGLGLAMTGLPAAALINLNTRVLDLYGPGNNQTQQQSYQSGQTFGSANVQSWRASASTPWRQGGLAFARSAWTQHDLVFGTSALARSTDGFNGDASAVLRSDFTLDVIIDMGQDPVSIALLTALLARGNCCRFDVSFLHTTHGRLAYVNESGDRRAYFQETLTLGPATVFGEVTLNLSNGSPLASVATRGAWTPADLTAFGPTPASQLGLFPAGDPRNSLDDPLGDLRGFEFLHTEVIRLPLFFTLEGMSTLAAHLPVTVQQVAVAGLNRAGTTTPSYSSSTLSVDFADTSTLAPAGLFDPEGELDLSTLTLQIRQVTPVPEPAPAWLLLAGGLLLMRLRRR